MQSMSIHFKGPLTFTAGDHSLFRSPHRDDACVYLWTIQADSGRKFFIHYIGEAESFAKRQKEHLVQLLGLNYGVFDPAEAREGKLVRVWRGLWRDKGDEIYDNPAEALAWYRNNAETVLNYIGSLAIFVAPVEGDAALRKHVEGSIGRNLRNNHPESRELYPNDNRVGTSKTKRDIRLEVSWDAEIAGLDPTLDI